MMDKIGFLAICAAAFFWGTVGIVGKRVFATGIDPFTVVVIRILVPFILIGCYIFLFDRKKIIIRKKDLLLFVFCGIATVALTNICYFKAIDLTTATTAVILLYTSPAFVIILAYFLLRESINWIKLSSLTFTMLGCWLVVKGYDVNSLKVNLPGILYGLGSGVTYAMYSILGRSFTKNYHPLTVVFYAFGVAGLFIALFKSPMSIIEANLSLDQWLHLLYIGIFGSLVPYTLYTWGLSRGESGIAAVIAAFEPIVASLLAYFILGEILEIWQIFGIFMVIMAMVLTKVRISS